MTESGFIKYIPPDPPLTKEELELFGLGLVRRRLVTRDELKREFPDTKPPTQDEGK